MRVKESESSYQHKMVQRTFLFVGEDGLMYRWATTNLCRRQKKKRMQTHFVPLQPHYISVFVSQTISRCLVTGYCGDVMELQIGGVKACKRWSPPLVKLVYS